jgi:hypothetical protein
MDSVTWRNGWNPATQGDNPFYKDPGSSDERAGPRHSRLSIARPPVGGCTPPTFILCSGRSANPAMLGRTVRYQLSVIIGAFPPQRGRQLAAHGNAMGMVCKKTSPARAPHDYVQIGTGRAGRSALSERILFGGRFSHRVAMG